MLNDAGGKYGDNIIDEYSKKLVVEVGKKYNRRTLFMMKQFYSMFSDERVSQIATQLSWSHYVELLPLKNIDEMNPKYSVISVGKNNRYGHPNKEVLNNLEQSKMYRTDRDGSII